MDRPPPDVSVLIVTYNVREYAARCLASLPAAFTDRSWEVIVVDNQSSDGTAEALATRFPEAAIVESPVNDGFGAGINRAAARARGRYLLVLNPDCEMQPGAGRELALVLDQYPQIAVVGPQLRESDGSVQSSRRRFPGIRTALIESTPLQPRFDGSRVLREFYVRDQPDDVAQQVDWLVGAAFMIRREVWDAVGAFDPGFFLYFEETDWFRRLAVLAASNPAIPPVVWFQPSAVVVHHGDKSAGQNLGRRHVAFQDSKCRYYGKHHGRVIGGLLRAYLWGWSAIQLAEETAKYLAGHKRPLRRGRIRDLLLALRTGLHPS